MSLTLSPARAPIASTLGLAACLLAGTVIAALAAPAADSAKGGKPAPSAPAATRTAVAEQAPAAEAMPACGKSRRKLWLEGEGWVVRRVYAC